MRVLPHKLGRALAREMLSGRYAQQVAESQAWLTNGVEQLPSGLPVIPTTLQRLVMANLLADYHLMTVDRRAMIRTQGGWRFHCHCVCGKQVLLKAADLMARYEVGLGCGDLACPAPSYLVQAWYDLRAAFQLQVSQVATLYAPFRAALSSGQTVASVTEDWLRLYGPLVTSPGRWWLGQLHDLDPDFLQFRRVPSKLLFPQGRLMIRLSGEPITVDEAALAMESSVEEIVEMKQFLWDEQIEETLLNRLEHA